MSTDGRGAITFNPHGPEPEGRPATPARGRPTAASALAAGFGLNRTWPQPLEIHARLSSLVGPAPLHLDFDCADEDFEFALTSSWPRVDTAAGQALVGKTHVPAREADLLKLAETLNGLVRIYALETGTTAMHVLVEARRGVLGVPPWWDGAPCLFAVFGFDTGFSEAGLFTDPMQAFAAMEMIMTPHRLLLAVGPARPEWHEDTGEEAWLDADARRIAALKRIEADMSKDIARLMANTVDLTRLMADAEMGGMAMEEALMDGLSRVRGAVQKMRGAILGYEMKRSHKRAQKAGRELKLEAPTPAATPAPQQQRQKENQALADLAERQTLAKTVRELQTVLRQESASPKMPLPARATFRRSLTALTTLESVLQVPDAARSMKTRTPQAAVQAIAPKIKAPRTKNLLPTATAPLRVLVQKIVKNLKPKKARRRLMRPRLLKRWLKQQQPERPVDRLEEELRRRLDPRYQP